MIDFTPLDAAHFAQNTDERHELDALEKRLNRSGLGKPRYSLELQAASDTPPGALLTPRRHRGGGLDRKSGGQGKGGEIRGAFGGRRIITKKNKKNNTAENS